MRIAFIKYLLLVVGSILLFSSCKTYKTATIVTIDKKISLENIKERVIQQHKISEELSIRYSAKITSKEKNQSVSGIIRLKPDSLIWISMGPSIGMELFRMVATHDSVKFINRTNQTYYKGDYNYLNKLSKMDMSYYLLESMLLSKVFNYNKLNNLEELAFKSINDNNYVVSNYKLNRKAQYKKKLNYLQSTEIKANSFTHEKTKIEDIRKNRNIKIHYKAHQVIENMSVPKEIVFTLIDNENEIDIDIKYHKISLGKDLKFPFRINKRYTRI